MLASTPILHTLVVLNMVKLEEIKTDSSSLESRLAKNFGMAVFALLILDKISQVKRLPKWTGHRALAYRVFGPEFIPIASSARRAQQLIMGTEMFFFTFPPFVYLIFGEHSMLALWWLLGWKSFCKYRACLPRASGGDAAARRTSNSESLLNRCILVLLDGTYRMLPCVVSSSPPSSAQCGRFLLRLTQV